MLQGKAERTLEAGEAQLMSLSPTSGAAQRAVQHEGCSPKLKHFYFWDIRGGWGSWQSLYS